MSGLSSNIIRDPVFMESEQAVSQSVTLLSPVSAHYAENTWTRRAFYNWDFSTEAQFIINIMFDLTNENGRLILEQKLLIIVTTPTNQGRPPNFSYQPLKRSENHRDMQMGLNALD